MYLYNLSVDFKNGVMKFVILANDKDHALELASSHLDKETYQELIDGERNYSIVEANMSSGVIANYLS